jgi:hypothetical protein
MRKLTEGLSVPWVYLGVLVVAGIASTALAVGISRRIMQRRAIQELRTI